MSGVIFNQPKGALRVGWSASVDDYAIAGGWALKGEALLVADSAGGVHAFEGSSGKLRWAQRGAHAGGLLTSAINPDGATVATGGQDGCARLWSARDGAPGAVLAFGDGWVEHLAWSPDGRWLAVTCKREVRVYSMSGEELWRSPPHPSTVSALAWSGADVLATACYGRVTFFQMPTGSESQRLEWKGSLISMVLSPDGKIVACGSQDNSVHFWRRSSGQDSMMSGYPGKPAVLAFDDKGRLLATSGSEAVTVWSFEGDGPEDTKPGVLELHVMPISALAFEPRAQRLASGSRDGAVVLWTLNQAGHGEPCGVVQLPQPITGLQWRPDGRGLAAFDACGSVTAWRVGK